MSRKLFYPLNLQLLIYSTHTTTTRIHIPPFCSKLNFDLPPQNSQLPHIPLWTLFLDSFLYKSYNTISFLEKVCSCRIIHSFSLEPIGGPYLNIFIHANYLLVGGFFFSLTQVSILEIYQKFEVNWKLDKIPFI